jgi:RNA 2',3'-cyclic 3'-phosphodiesterase
MRLFIAFDVPEDVRKILESVQDKIKFSGKATKAKEFHLTLKFLGEVEESKLTSLIDSLSTVKFSPFEARLGSIGAFPSRSKASVIWVGLEPHGAIGALQEQVDTATRKLGFVMDKEFHPHLTLARIKSIENRKEFENMLNSLKAPEGAFKVSSFNLIKSTLTAEGPVYEVLRDFKAQQ